VSCGVPETVTASLNSIRTRTTSPAFSVPLEGLEVILETVGSTVSIIIAFDPAILLVPEGTVVVFITFPEVSVGATVRT
jgi:hypothetical protein